MKPNLKILICRSDNLGDLLISLSAIIYLRLALPEAELSILAKRANLQLLKSFLKEQRIGGIALEEPWEKERWDVFLSLFSDFSISAKCFLKRIPLRVGQYSKPWSFLFFNRGKRQKRSMALKSEGKYSLELVQEIFHEMGIKGEFKVPPLKLPLDERESELASQALEKIGIQSDKPFLVIHPGMAGSALNLSGAQYAEIIKKMIPRIQCVASVGPSKQDQMIWADLETSVPGVKKMEGLELSVLKEVFRKSRAVIAPSTGPLHLAHLVGVPVIGIYSPVQAHHPRRWAPWGGYSKAIVHSPQVVCPGKRTCLGTSCPEFNCMEKIDWASLILKELDGLT